MLGFIELGGQLFQLLTQLAVKLEHAANWFGSYRLVDVINQKPRLSVFDHLTARAKVHGDSGHTSGIGFCQDKSESLRDSVQVQQSSGMREQLILARYVHRPDVADRPTQRGAPQ